jgi:hypothetical protein
MPTGAWFAARGEAGGAIIGVPDCDHTSVDVRCQGVDRIEDRLRDTAGFVDDHQHVARVDALESSRVIVSRLSAVGDELVAYVPLGVERDAARQTPAVLVGRRTTSESVSSSTSGNSSSDVAVDDIGSSRSSLGARSWDGQRCSPSSTQAKRARKTETLRTDGFGYPVKAHNAVHPFESIRLGATPTLRPD